VEQVTEVEQIFMRAEGFLLAELRQQLITYGNRNLKVCFKGRRRLKETKGQMLKAKITAVKRGKHIDTPGLG